jgi:general L-amino acid transport system permease protein
MAEIVRAGVRAVGQGQWQAGMALGLRRSQTLRAIVLPQALRVIVPPMTSQYLNLTKNSSLAVAIGYPDLVSVVGTVIEKTGQAVEGVLIIMAAYLTVSLTISLLMNVYNHRLTRMGQRNA